MKHFIGGKSVAVDTETTGLELWHGDQPFAFGFCNEHGHKRYFEWDVCPFTRTVIPKEDELEQIALFMMDERIEKIFHNAKYDVRAFETFGIKTKGRIHDTLLMAQVARSNEMSYGLKDLSVRYLNISKDDEKELQRVVVKCRRQAKKLGWELGKEYKLRADGHFDEKGKVAMDYWMPRALDRTSRVCRKYCLRDTERTQLLKQMYWQILEEDDNMAAYEFEMYELWPVVYNMMSYGVFIDEDRLDSKIVEVTAEARRHLKTLKSYTKGKLNLKSNKQLSTFLFSPSEEGGLGLTPTRFTDKGNASVDQESLSRYIEHPFIESMFRYNSCTKAVDTYFLTYKRKGIPEPGGIGLHCELDQNGADATGRFSCRNPNLQNVTSSSSGRGHFLIQARSPFGPRPGYRWYPADYSQLEVRIFADVGNISTMLDAIYNGRDIHSESVNRVWGGDNNPAAVRAALAACEWGERTPSNDKVRALWKRFGWVSGYGVPKAEGEKCAYAWLKSHKFNIEDTESEVDKKNSRSRGKLLVFCKLYGGGAGAASGLLKCSAEEAAQVLAEYDERFPEVQRYISRRSRKAARDGFVETRFGRKLTVDPNFAYKGVNYEVQGSAAGLLKYAMVNMDRFIKESEVDARLLLCVHDEIVVEVKEEEATRPFLWELGKVMEDHGGAFNVPTPVEISRVRSNWNEKEKINMHKWGMAA